MLPGGQDAPVVIGAVWQGEGLGMLFWALGLAELEPYGRPFDGSGCSPRRPPTAR